MPDIAKDLCAAFSFLEHYGFTAPEVSRLGAEISVSFHRGNETLSITVEANLRPVIEIFEHCEGTDQPPLPWAVRHGVNRYRRFPSVAGMTNFLIDAPRLLEQSEQTWLNGNTL